MDVITCIYHVQFSSPLISILPEACSLTVFISPCLVSDA